MHQGFQRVLKTHRRRRLRALPLRCVERSHQSLGDPARPPARGVLSLSACVEGVRPLYTDEKANRNGRDFGMGGRSRGRFETPADFLYTIVARVLTCSPYSHVRARRESLGFVPRSRAIFCPPRAERFATFASLYMHGPGAHHASIAAYTSCWCDSCALPHSLVCIVLSIGNPSTSAATR
jgi:hypothetical protein